jgi:glycine hydroxymethyltransferase
MILARKDLARKINSAVFPNMQGGPLEHTIAAKAVAFKEASAPDFKLYQEQVITNAKILASTLKDGGLRLVSSGTDNHMVLVDLTPLGITGKEAEDSLSRSNIVVNRNAIPFDKLPPRQASGMRLGTPALTSRGMREPAIKEVGNLILQVLSNLGDTQFESNVQQQALNLLEAYPAPGISSP